MGSDDDSYSEGSSPEEEEIEYPDDDAGDESGEGRDGEESDGGTKKRKRRPGPPRQLPDYLADFPLSEKSTLDTALLAALRTRLRDLLYAGSEGAGHAGDFAGLLIGQVHTNPDHLWRVAVHVIRSGAPNRDEGLRRAGRWLLHLLAMRLAPAIKMEVLLELATCLADQGRFEEAQQRLEGYLTKEPYAQNALLHGYSGLLLYKLWRRELAELQNGGDHWSQQVQYSQMPLDPAGEPAEAQQLRKRAVEALRASLALDIRNSLFLSHLVQLLEVAGEYDEALDLLLLQSERYPDDPTAWRHLLVFLDLHRDQITVATSEIVSARMKLFRLHPGEDVRLTLAPLFAYWDPVLALPRTYDPIAEDHPYFKQLESLKKDLYGRAFYIEKLFKLEILLEHLDFAGGSASPSPALPDLVENDHLLEPFGTPQKWAWGEFTDCIVTIVQEDPSLHARLWRSRASWWPAYHFNPDPVKEAATDPQLVTIKACAARFMFPEHYPSFSIRRAVAIAGADEDACARYGVQPEDLIDPVATEEAVSKLAGIKRGVRPRYIDLEDDEDKPAPREPLRTTKAQTLDMDEGTWRLTHLKGIREALKDPAVIEFTSEHPRISEAAKTAVLLPHLRTLMQALYKYGLTREVVSKYLGWDVKAVLVSWVRCSQPDLWGLLESLREVEAQYVSGKLDVAKEKTHQEKATGRKLRKEVKEKRTELAGKVVEKLEKLKLDKATFEEYIGPSFRFKNALGTGRGSSSGASKAKGAKGSASAP